MFGPELIARTISSERIPDKFGNHWQYHSQSDRHSKVTCWAVLFDLLLESSLLRDQAKSGKIGFGINHEMRDFQTGRKKDLDLVICTPGPSQVKSSKKSPRNFVELGAYFSLVLSEAEEKALSILPEIQVVSVGSVNVALEAKAAMTAHIKALPRLHDELDSSHVTVHGHADHAIAVATVLVNSATTFLSPNRNKNDLQNHQRVVNEHAQPKAASRTVEKIREIRRRSGAHHQGFDAVGIVMIDFPNDGTVCTIDNTHPAPSSTDSDHYEQMVRRISSLYASKFAGL
jgi:hypothetical protein